MVRRVATVTGRDATQLPPLYETIDPDALDGVVDSLDASAGSGAVTFEYADHRVSVDAAGTVRVGTDAE